MRLRMVRSIGVPLVCGVTPMFDRSCDKPKDNFTMHLITYVHDTSPDGVPDRDRRGGIVHARGRAAVRLAARALTPDQDARDQRGRRAGGAAAPHRAAHAD